ncbi:hypothetical protein ACFQHN_18315 [Natrialbaceae archaeon GCM10025896]
MPVRDPATATPTGISDGGAVAVVRPSTILIVVGVVLVVVPIPVLPPFVGTAVGVLLVALGLAVRLLGL